jgi:hypothetical protein
VNRFVQFPRLVICSILKGNSMRLFSRLTYISVIINAVSFNAFLSISLFAAADPEAMIRLLSGKIQVDGILNDAPWQEPPNISNLTQVEPHPGEPPTEATKVWLTYTKDSLYIAVRCEDRSPNQQVFTEMRRDAFLMDNDNIEIILDTYHDHRNAYFFSTNPAGALVDGRISENQGAAIEWDGIWNVRTHIDDQGWTAEFEIPFKTIGFNPSISKWGFNLSRFLTRGRETSRWASPSLNTPIFQIANAGHIAGIEQPSQGIGLDIKSYGIVGFTRDIENRNIVQPSGVIGEDLTKAAHSGGIDIFYRLTANLVSSTTINTDFAETEADARQVNLTRFQLYFPEKRSFFLEDAGTFEFAKIAQDGPPGFNMGGDLIPFFSRRIGLVENPIQGYSEVPLRVGEKLTGKIGRFDVGLFDVQTGSYDEPPRVDKPGFQLASKNLSVGRVKANFLSQSYIGAMFTNGDPAGQSSNQMGGIDFKLATSNFLNKRKNVSLMLFGSRTSTTGLTNRDTAYGGALSYPNDVVILNYKWMNIGENYNPALGFVPRPGVRISSFSSEISPRPEFWNIRQMSFELGYDDYYSTVHRDWESKALRLVPFQLNMNNGDFTGYEFTRNQEQLFYPWTISERKGIVLLTGKYTHHLNTVMFVSSQIRPISVMSSFGIGTFFSGTRRRYDMTLTWRKNRHLTTSYYIEQNWLNLREGKFSTTMTSYRMDYAFTPFISLANFVQYDTDSRNIGLQSRLRWIMKPGNEFFVVVNHSWQENALDRFESAQTRFRIKLNYTFRF